MPSTTYQVTVGGRVLRVQVRRNGDDVSVQVDDGPPRSASLRSVHGVLRSLQLGQQHTELLAARDADGVSVSMGGLELRAEVLDEAHARLASVAGHAPGHTRRELKSPMPGLLINLLCQPGDSVEPGQPLAVLQAMKMENELSLPRGGTVVSVNATPGQSVEQGQVLVVVE